MNLNKIEVMFTEEEVNERIRALGEQISRDYEGREVHLICILRGSSTSSGIVRIIKDLEEPLKGKDIIVVEDIIDSGRTLHFLQELFRTREAASVRLCTLLDKPSRRAPEIDITVDYLGFQVPDAFVVGWGMDFDQRYRNLPYIGVIKETEK